MSDELEFDEGGDLEKLEQAEVDERQKAEEDNYKNDL